MSRTAQVGVVVALLAAFAIGLTATITAPDGLTGAVPWPIGVATGVALMLRQRGALAVVALTVVEIGFANLVDGNSVLDSVATAVAQGVGASAVILMITHLGRRRAVLLREADIGWYIGSAALGSAACGATLALFALAEGEQVGRAFAGIGLEHLTSQLLLLPFFLRMHTHRAIGRVPERTVQWVATLGVTVVVFSSHTNVPTLFLVLTALSWGARRLGTWEALVQMLLVGTISSTLTLNDRGPFVGLGPDWGRDGAGVVLEVFLGCCAFVVVPLVLSVGTQLEGMRVAAVQSDFLAGIVRSAHGSSIIATNAERRITLFNPASERMLGYTEEEMIGQSPAVFYPPGKIERLSGELGVGNDFLSVSRALTRPENAGRLIRQQCADGQVRTHLATVNPVRDSDGVITGFVKISEDVTTQVEEQEAIQQALDRLRAVDEAKDVFVSGVSHELRTPLASIVGYLEMLQDGDYGDLAPRQMDAVQRIATNSGRLLSLIDDLLMFSRLGDDTSWIERVELDLRKVVVDACHVMEPAWHGRDLTVTVLTPDDALCVLGDRATLERLVLNLVGNAVKFTPDGGDVEVEVTRQDDDALVVVSDTGCGIPADELPQLFTRFFRSRRSLEQAVPGTGLGMSIVRSVAEAHGGRIDVSSIVDAGTTVTVRLPVRAAPDLHARDQ